MASFILLYCIMSRKGIDFRFQKVLYIWKKSKKESVYFISLSSSQVLITMGFLLLNLRNKNSLKVLV